jgi:hypothetical protein
MIAAAVISFLILVAAEKDAIKNRDRTTYAFTGTSIQLDEDDDEDGDDAVAGGIGSAMRRRIVETDLIACSSPDKERLKERRRCKIIKRNKIIENN